MKLGIQAKLLGFTLLISIVMSGLIVGYAVHRQQDDFMEDIEARGKSLAAVLAQTLIDPVYQLRVDEVTRLLAAATTDREILSAYALDREGLVIGTGREDELLLNEKLPDIAPTLEQIHKTARPTVRTTGKQLHVTAPIRTADDAIIGFVHLQFTVEHAIEDANEATASMVLISLLVMLIGGLIAVVLARSFSGQITAMLEGAHKIGAGHFDVQVPVGSQDELGQLSQAINRMALSLGEKTVSKDYLDNVIRSIADILIVAASDGRIRRMNDAVEKCLHYQEHELIGRPVDSVVKLEPGAGVRAWFDSISAQGLETVCVDASGREIPVSLSVSRLMDGDGKPDGWVMVAKDITERKLTEEALHQARRNAEAASLAKSEFLANMSHEIRTPMNAILGMAELLSESELTREQRRYVGIFQNAGNTLLELINDILDLSKVEAGQLELDKGDFSLEQTLNEQIDLHAIRAFDKGLELVLDIKPGVPEFVYGDAKRIKQCLTNLVGNAIKFSTDGSIVVCVQPVYGKPDMLRFSVSDSGIGIPAEKRESIFDAFSQVDSSVTRRFGGTGLGLTITRRLANLMGGEIWVDSQEGKGSTFHFTALLPQATHPVYQPALPADLRGLKMLVVDDLSINRTIVRQYLQPLGAEVSEAESAKQAISLLSDAATKGEPFSLALIDCQMPDTDGMELSVQIRANPALADLKIMIISSDDTAQQRHRAKGLALPLLFKPIKRQELIQAIGRELQQHKMAAPKTEALSPAALTLSGGLNILLAEDNPDNVTLIQAFLRNMPYHIDVAEDGLVALEKFRANRYDVILMDVQMPKMDGYEATAEIRRIEAAEGRTPTIIIALTAHALKEDEQRSFDVGCSGHLTKPIKKKVLLEALQSIK